MGNAINRWAPHAAFGAGALAALALVIGSPVRTHPAGGVRVSVSANLSGRLDVRPFGVFALGDDLRPGERVVGRTAILDQTPRTLTLEVRAGASARTLDDVTMVRIELGGRTLADASLAELRAWGASRRLVLHPGRPSELQVEVRLQQTAEARRYGGQVVDVPLEFRTELARGER